MPRITEIRSPNVDFAFIIAPHNFCRHIPTSTLKWNDSQNEERETNRRFLELSRLYFDGKAPLLFVYTTKLYLHLFLRHLDTLYGKLELALSVIGGEVNMSKREI